MTDDKPMSAEEERARRCIKKIIHLLRLRDVVEIEGNIATALRDHAAEAVEAERIEVERLREFRNAVMGWREFDWPAGFCRWTAQQIADNAARAELRAIRARTEGGGSDE